MPFVVVIEVAEFDVRAVLERVGVEAFRFARGRRAAVGLVLCLELAELEFEAGEGARRGGGCRRR